MMRVRALALVYGVAVLLWFQFEDSSVLPAAGYGWAGAALLALARGQRWGAWPGRSLRRRLVFAGGLGAGAGLGASALAAGLMLVKTGLHGHAYPDYTAAQITGMLGRAPVWAAAGLLAGAGLALASRAVREDTRPTAHDPSRSDESDGDSVR